MAEGSQDPSWWQAFGLAVATAVGAALAAWRKSRRHGVASRVQSGSPQDRDRRQDDYGRRLEDLQRAYEAHMTDVVSARHDVTVLQAEVRHLQEDRDRNRAEIVARIEQCENRLDVRLARIEDSLIAGRGDGKR